MPPQENFSDVGEKSFLVGQLSVDDEQPPTENDPSRKRKLLLCAGVGLVIVSIMLRRASGALLPTGPYNLVELQEGEKFFDYYDFYDGADSLGSGLFLSILLVTLCNILFLS